MLNPNLSINSPTNKADGFDVFFEFWLGTVKSLASFLSISFSSFSFNLHYKNNYVMDNRMVYRRIKLESVFVAKNGTEYTLE